MTESDQAYISNQYLLYYILTGKRIKRREHVTTVRPSDKGQEKFKRSNPANPYIRGKKDETRYRSHSHKIEERGKDHGFHVMSNQQVTTRPHNGNVLRRFDNTEQPNIIPA